MLHTKEVPKNRSEESGQNDQTPKDDLPCEATEAIGKPAIPLPCPESFIRNSIPPSCTEDDAFIMKQFDENPLLRDTAIELYDQYLRPLEGQMKQTEESCPPPELFDENGHHYVGLFNQAMTCYLNSLIQTLYMTPEFRNEIYSWKFVDTATDEENKNIPYQLQKLFLLLQTSERSSLETKALTTSFGWVSNEAFEQHDVQELCRIMFDALEQRCRSMENPSVVQDLYKGTMEDYVKCLGCGKENVRKDIFLDLSLAVKQFDASEAFNSIEEALSAFIKPETLDKQNLYHCEMCASPQNAEKGLRIVEFPYLLTIQLKRFDFDYETLHRIKLNNKVTFPDYLDINGFVHSPQAAPQAKPSQWLLDEDSRQKHIAELLEHGKYVYELFSIMVHQGSASAGHYFAYIKNLDQNRWFCFNDSSVHSASLNDIFRTFGGHSNGWMNNMNAYMLMYRQIDPCRNRNFIKNDELPDHLKQLKDKLKKEEDERIRRRESEQTPIQGPVNANLASPPHSGDAGEGTSSDGGHLSNQEINARRLRICLQDWLGPEPSMDPGKVSAINSADLPLVEGAGDGLFVAGGDDLHMDTSCPGTPQISPMVSADEGDGEDKS